MTPGTQLNIGDEFHADGQTWIVRGWYSSVGHIAAETAEGLRRVFSIHASYYVSKLATPTP